MSNYEFHHTSLNHQAHINSVAEVRVDLNKFDDVPGCSDLEDPYILSSIHTQRLLHSVHPM
ncbi:hypothetical protein CsSME_00003068 [Camellia sinensis var. sinensis]